MSILLMLTFASTAANLNLPPGLLESICFVESTYNPDAVHEDDGGSDSLGICQIKSETAEWLGFDGEEDQLMNPDVNIYYAGKYLRHQLDRYHNVEKAIVAYNMGSAKHLTKTEYSDKVIRYWRTRYVSSGR